MLKIGASFALLVIFVVVVSCSFIFICFSFELADKCKEVGLTVVSVRVILRNSLGGSFDGAFS